MYVYILQSKKNSERYYVGKTKDLKKRLQEHNSGKVNHTSKFRPWKYKNAIWFDAKQKAHEFEQYLKTGSGRIFAKRHF